MGVGVGDREFFLRISLVIKNRIDLFSKKIERAYYGPLVLRM